MKRVLGLYLYIFVVMCLMIFNQTHACPTHVGVIGDDTPPFFSDEAYDVSELHASNGTPLLDDDIEFLHDGA